MCSQAAFAYNREWNARNRDKRASYVRKSRLVRRYGITEDEYLVMVAERDNRCDICGRPPGTGRNQDKLHIDHDHETGVVRGLLCNQCNRAIGLLGDTMDRLLIAVEYLRKANA